MPAKWFICPDQQRVEIEKCLAPGGCRLKNRCAPMAYLRAASFDREWKGISPSSAGSDARLIWLKAVKPYAVDPASRAFSLLGTAVHGKLSLHDYNVLAEETLSDEQMQGVADLLEKNEYGRGYILTDYKTFGSYKVMKCLGIKQVTVQIQDENGEPARFKSGQRKGKIKTKREMEIKPEHIDMKAEILQLNRYRIFFEKNGFPVSRMQLFCIVRDGGTRQARSNMIDRNVYTVPVPRLDNKKVLSFYNELDRRVKAAFEQNDAPMCSDELSWNGRRCKSFCEVSEYCGYTSH
ncbi:MAG: hypothetical protein OCU18_03825 [Candidatus Syntrophoarchaeum sp.]|nr:hypothetical protein [Candidatus Syntrophoarchaeum sp.]